MSQYMLIVDISELTHQLIPGISERLTTYNIPLTELENLFDWIITEGFSNVLKLSVKGHIHILHHRDNDAYRCVYDDIGFWVESLISGMVQANGLHFLSNQIVKLLVTYQQLIIVKTTHTQV